MSMLYHPWHFYELNENEWTSVMQHSLLENQKADINYAAPNAFITFETELWKRNICF